MPRHVFSKEETQQGGKIQGVRSRDAKLGFFAITPGSPEDIENRRKGGVTQGNIQGNKNLESGELDRIRLLPQTKEAQSRAGKTIGTMYGKIYGPLADMDKVRTTAGCKLGQKRGGLASRHQRHHFNRKLFNPQCSMCRDAKTRGEHFWTAIYIPSTNGKKAGKIKPLSEYEHI